MNLSIAEVYIVFFQDKLPKVLPQMKEALQFPPYRRIEDEFQLQEHTIIRVYGFNHELSILPSFLTPRLFYLEMII